MSVGKLMEMCGWRTFSRRGDSDSFLMEEEYRVGSGEDEVSLVMRVRLDGGMEFQMRCGSASVGSRCFGEDGGLADCLWFGVADIRDGIMEQQSAWHRVETVYEVMEVAGRRLSALYVMRQAIDSLMKGVMRIALEDE